MSYNELKYLLDEITPILLTHGYKPSYYFEGSPVTGSEGLIVTIKFEKPLSEEVLSLIKRLMRAFGVEICGDTHERC
jgi:hypothetical protein